MIGRARVFVYRVTGGELDAFAKKMHHDVSRRPHIDNVAAGKEDSITVDGGGKPFHTTARADPAFWSGFGDGSPPRQTAYGWLNVQWQPLTT
jgi:hypothetical protein